MYSYEEKKQAVEAYFKMNSLRAVRKTLGYPAKNTLISWIKEFKETGTFKETFTRSPKYTDEQREYAIDYYVNNGRCISKTIRDLGYPCRQIMDKWISEEFENLKEHRNYRKSMVNLSKDQKREAAIELSMHEDSANTIAKKYDVDRTSLYNWKHILLPDKEKKPMDSKVENSKHKKSSVDELKNKLAQMQKEYDELAKKTYRMKLEYDALEAASEIIKKDQGITLKNLTNRDKAIVIGTLREKYSLKELLSVFKMAKSSYFYQEKALHSTDKYLFERKLIKDSFIESRETYGYRRIYIDLKNKNVTLSEKVIRRLMKEENLKVRVVKRKKYSSYLGEISPAVPNIVNRDFHANKPNVKWLTDITEFHIPAGKVYLSPIIDCFDGLPVSWTIGTSPNAELVNAMLDEAVTTLKTYEKPIVHSDRGAHYRWPSWISKMNENQLIRSMSKKGCSPDNSACEGFFGRLKNEMFYGKSWTNTSIDEFIDILDDYIRWYGEKRIKTSLGMSPIDYRKSLGWAG